MQVRTVLVSSSICYQNLTIVTADQIPDKIILSGRVDANEPHIYVFRYNCRTIIISPEPR